MLGERSQDILARRSEGGGIMKIPISKLLNNTGQIEGVPTNPRTIDKADYQKLLKSIQEDPEYLDHEKPHVIAHGDKYVVLNGNQRLRALRELKFTETPVTIYKPDTPPEVIRARIIKSNHGYGKDDFDMLANEWSDDPLDDWGMDLPDDWLENDDEIVEDEAPEVSDQPPVSKLGEIYQLGRHRVMCGDSTSLTDAELLMNGKNASIAFTSPPYNAGTTPTEVKMGKKSKYANDSDNKSQDDYLEFMQLWTNIANEYSEYNFVNVQMLSGNKLALLDYLSLYRNNLADIIIWNKLTAQPAMADNVLNSQFEFILVFSDKSNRAIGTKHFRGTASNVLDISKQTNNEVKDHNATFPVELPHNIVTTFSNKDEIILDLFLGSGSTLIASEQTDRTCYGMELDPKYVDVIRKRYWKFVNGGNEEGWENGTPAI